MVILVRLPLATSAFVLLLFAAYGVATPSSAPSADASSYPAADLSTALTFGCQSDGSVSVEFRWISSNAGPQWLDVSRVDDNFSSYFLGHGPIASGAVAFTWYGIDPNTWYHVRINTLTSNGWYASPTMHFLAPSDCPGVPSPRAEQPGPPTCPSLIGAYLTGCVWNERSDYGVYEVGELVNYCFYVTQPTNARVVVSKPDGTSIVVTDAYVNPTGACFGPFQAYYPEGLRTVRLYGGGVLLDQTHFYVDD